MDYSHEHHEVDGWEKHRQELKRQYVAAGMSDEAADDKATLDVRREIRSGPPIRRG